MWLPTKQRRPYTWCECNSLFHSVHSISRMVLTRNRLNGYSKGVYFPVVRTEANWCAKVISIFFSFSSVYEEKLRAKPPNQSKDWAPHNESAYIYTNFDVWQYEKKNTELPIQWLSYFWINESNRIGLRVHICVYVYMLWSTYVYHQRRTNCKTW